MDNELIEKRIDELLIEQQEIRVLVLENRDMYLLHLAVHLTLLAVLYIDLVGRCIKLNQLDEAEEYQKKISVLHEEANNIITELQTTIINARPLNKQL